MIMVRIHVKKGDESQFLFDSTVKEPVQLLVQKLVKIYNARLKIDRLYYEIEDLSKHGIALPPNMQGLTEEQIQELKLEDKWSLTTYPSGGSIERKDPIGRRNGNSPNEKMAEILNKTRHEAKEQVSKNLVDANKSLTYEEVQDALDKMQGSLMIVYPMGLPPHDPIRMEFENREDLSGTQASKEVLQEDETSVWWASKELSSDKILEEYVGRNEKTKVVVKLQKRGKGAPSREPVMSESEQKALMAHYYKKQEDMKKLESDDAETHLNSKWADPNLLKRQFQGLNDVKWGAGFR